MMGEEESYLISNLVSLGAGQTVGRFHMGGHWARVMFRIYAAPRLHVEFSAPQIFQENLTEFVEHTKAERFCRSLWQRLDRSSQDLCEMSVGRRGALGLIAMIDAVIRDAASGGEQL